ncbi:hypothetical protein [Streptomyces sp. NPDC054797]
MLAEGPAAALAVPGGDEDPVEPGGISWAIRRRTAQPAPALRPPSPGTLAGGAASEQKFHGHRALLFTPASPGGRVVLQTRRGPLVLPAVAESGHRPGPAPTSGGSS